MGSAHHIVAFETARTIEFGHDAGTDFVRIPAIEHFDLPAVFDNGQCFRWEKISNSHYIGVAFGRVLEVKKQNGDLLLHNTNKKDFYDIWFPYFTLDIDYPAITHALSKDPLLHKAITFAPGLRLLRQDFLETMISFILSSNNNIQRIKKTIHDLCAATGTPLRYQGNEYRAFPSLDAMRGLSVEDYKAFGAGYRGTYLVHTIETLANRGIDIQALKKGTLDEARKTLQGFKGIGIKVADCILLYSGMRYDCFPTDTWIKKVMAHYVDNNESMDCIQDFAASSFGVYAGFAQQYLFHYIRNKNKNTPIPSA